MQLHRIVRNPYTRAVYDRLQSAGVTATWMHEYVRFRTPVEDPESECSYVVTSCDPDGVSSLDAPVDELVSSEVVIGAFADEAPLGYLFLSVDATMEIHPLERELEFEGGYVRRVFVAPEHRQRGVAGALLEEACRLADERGVDRVTALVARDNIPSRALFESREFRVVRDHRYVRVGPLSHYSMKGREQSQQ